MLVMLAKDVELAATQPVIVQCNEDLIMCIMPDDGNVTLNIYGSVTVVYTV